MKNEKKLTHIDLFSGIGGFTLAAEWAGFKTIVFCEKEKFCQKVLKKHWPEIPIIPEIREFDGKKYRGAALLTGGFPCQPFSVAGRRRGKKDDRYLWPEMFKVISEAKPHWILAENVSGIVRMALDTVLSDLENEDYAAEALVIPACAVNAPHRRNRVWVVAYLDSRRRGGNKSSGQNQKTNSHASDSRKQERNWLPSIGRKEMAKIGRENQNASDPERLGRQEGTGKRIEYEKQISKGQDIRNSHAKRYAWRENWYEIATRLCRVDDGVSDRVHRLKALGNAIVPQIAYEILKNIVWIENELAE